MSTFQAWSTSCSTLDHDANLEHIQHRQLRNCYTKYHQVKVLLSSHVLHLLAGTCFTRDGAHGHAGLTLQFVCGKLRVVVGQTLHLSNLHSLPEIIMKAELTCLVFGFHGHPFAAMPSTSMEI